VGKGMHARKDGRAGRWGVLRGRAPGSHWRRRQLRLGRALRVVGTGVGAIGLAVALLGQSGVVSAPATQLAAKSTSTGPLLVVANRVSGNSVNGGDGGVVTYPTTLSGSTSAVGTFDGVDGPTDVAVDPQTGDVWVVNATNDELQVFSPSAIHAKGTLTPSETFTYKTSGYPEAITFDQFGDLYIANYRNRRRV
jgi:DNA-binding beta-propeller fold protein YncE